MVICYYKILNYNCYKLDNIIKIQLKHHNINLNGGIEFYKEFNLEELEKLFHNLNIKFEKCEKFDELLLENINVNDIISDIEEQNEIEMYNKKISSSTEDNQLYIDGQMLKYNDIEIIIVYDDERKLWFSAIQIAQMLKYTNTKKAIQTNVPNEYKIKLRELNNDWKNLYKNAQPHSIFINKKGLYILLINSNKNEAFDFKMWIFDKLYSGNKNI
jgi:hypothetical protein